jgi:hypothetical protein
VANASMAFIDLQVVALLNCYAQGIRWWSHWDVKMWWHRSANGSRADRVQKHNMNAQNGIHTGVFCFRRPMLHMGALANLEMQRRAPCLLW